MIICDFCSSPKTTWRYPAHDVPAISLGDSQELVEVQLNSKGGWAACDICHDLIERGEWDLLLDRSVARFPLIDYMPPSVFRATISAIHSAFRFARFGDPQRLT